MRLLAVIATGMLMFLLTGCGSSGSGSASGGEAGQSGQQEGESAAPKTVVPTEASTSASAASQSDSSSASSAPQALGNLPIVGIVGESVAATNFDFRVLDYFVTDNYYYLENPSKYGRDEQDVFPEAGRFVVVNYSVTNTGSGSLEPNLGATLEVEGGEQAEFYDETDAASHPSDTYGMDLAPRQIGLSQFIFDVPSDVKPTAVGVSILDDIDEAVDTVGAIDLARQDPKGAVPEEVLALQYEYVDMAAYEQAYALFAEQSQAKVSLQQYSDYMSTDPSAVTDYSFPSVSVNGDQASIERVGTFALRDGSEIQDKATQEAVFTDDGWKIVMRDDQIQSLLGQSGS